MRLKKQIIIFLSPFFLLNVFAENRIIVDQTGKGNFLTVQEAINSIRVFDPAGPTTIFVKNGTYKEKVVIFEPICNIRIVGEDKYKTIIVYDDYAKLNDMGTFRTYTMQIRGNDIAIENLTIQNSATLHSQAVALHTEGDRIVIKNCRLVGNVDTFYAGGENRRVYVTDTYIEGTLDFMFGGATVWFENCSILCKENSFMTATSTAQNIKYGFIYHKCKIALAGKVDSIYLGRPWRAYANTVFINCELPKGINPEGWKNWNKTDFDKTARFSEYNNYGPGSNTSKRVKWSKVLSIEESGEITRKKVLGDFDSLIIPFKP